jgi:hypothetical protein
MPRVAKSTEAAQDFAEFIDIFGAFSAAGTVTVA